MEPGTTCTVEGCTDPYLAKWYCRKHYSAFWRTGQPEVTRKYREEGERFVYKGYVYVIVNGKRKLEHRHVMEGVLGRELLPNENVHHINGDKQDNQPKNLELWSTSQPSGQRIIDKVRWARRLLAAYGHLVPDDGDQDRS